jgi:hypothetical protein
MKVPSQRDRRRVAHSAVIISDHATVMDVGKADESCHGTALWTVIRSQEMDKTEVM